MDFIFKNDGILEVKVFTEYLSGFYIFFWLPVKYFVPGSYRKLLRSLGQWLEILSKNLLRTGKQCLYNVIGGSDDNKLCFILSS